MEYSEEDGVMTYGDRIAFEASCESLVALYFHLVSLNQPTHIQANR